MKFEPNYLNIVDAAMNLRPKRLPLYEHIICVNIMEKILGTEFAALENGGEAEVQEFFRYYCRFFKTMTYDTVSYEVCLTSILPDSGAILGGRPGPIQNRSDFEKYPWDELADRYWALARRKFTALASAMPEGMKAVGGIGNGVLEISEDLVGYEYLSYMLADDPELAGDIYRRIGDLMVDVWQQFLAQFGDAFCVCRFGDDMGYKTGLLMPKQVIISHIIPQYRRIISEIKRSDKLFLWHSCGCIFDMMEDVISLGINVKHSNEEAVAPFEKWIALYGGKIGLFGGFDVDLLCQNDSEDIHRQVMAKGRRFRDSARGYALGSGNSIPDYVPAEGYLAMIRAVQSLREREILKNV